jgi:signal transduction histidine kinase/DNA-binding response OmpR family regulator
VHKSGRILVAEDDPEARELLVLLLGSRNYDVLVAADGIEALSLIRSERPDLLITDIVMPRMDGYELVRQLREDTHSSRTPVIFCSASYHEREVRAMAHQLGVFTTLPKPYDFRTVHNVVERALRSATAQSTAQTASAAHPQPNNQTQDRLHALVNFTRRLFANDDLQTIPESACRAVREILMAQCAELVVTVDSRAAIRRRESGLAEEAVRRLTSASLYREFVNTLESAGCVAFPMVPPEPTPLDCHVEPGEFVSMLGVPIASGGRHYGYLAVVNRIALTGFTEEDLAVARAIAAQVAVAIENVARRTALEQEIDQRVAAEAEVRRLNEDLERRVKERTAELEIANRELESFSYSVAHDLRSPLRLIDAHVQMLRDEEELTSPNAVGRLDHIRRGAAQMSALIDGLLGLSRVSHVEMKQEVVSLNVLLDEALEDLTQELHMRSIDWRIERLPDAKCDPALIRQVFVNLLANSVKYTRLRRGARIQVGVETSPKGTPCIFVRDNGVGFDMQYANKLFGVFQRLHRPDEFEGTGVGLATVRRIIERHGGEIWGESVLGEGATFRFTLAGMG